MRNITIASCFAFHFSSVIAQPGVSIARQYANSVVTVLTEDVNHQSLALGSGFIVSPGRVVTNYHVVEGAKYAKVLTSSGSSVKVDGVLAHSANDDLIILSAPGLSGSVTFSSDSVQIGERVYAIGSPEGLSNSLSEGIISGRRTIDGRSLVQITAPISPGSSGGPIVNEKGSVVGVAVGAYSSGQNLNFAIPVSRVRSLISSAVSPEKTTLPPARKAPSGARKDGGAGIAVSVAQIEWAETTRMLDGSSPLNGISFRNNSQSEISRVKVNLILTDSKGIPIDHLIMVLCSSGQRDINPSRFECETIPSGLTKFYGLRDVGNANYEKPRVMKRRTGEKLVVRVLDFEVVGR